MYYFNLSVALLLSLWLGTAVAQQPEAIINNLQKTAAKYPQEKVYVHLDKPNYITGDDIWFKAYIALGEQDRLSSMSRVLHVELVSPSSKTINNLHLLILHGISIGDIHLPDTLEEGTYHLRAYTNWMLNFPQKGIFDQAITIGHIIPDPVVTNTSFNYDGAAKRLTANIQLHDQNGQPLASHQIDYSLIFDNKANGEGVASTDDKGNCNITFNNNKNYSLQTGVLNLKVHITYNKVVSKNIKVILQPQNKIQFMPEGGNLVAGVQSRIAFKMLKPDGLSAKGSGYIADEAGNKITDFTTDHAGMGSLYITPEAGKNYKAVINYDNEQSQTVKLPTPLTTGYVLTLNQNLPGFINMLISASPDLVKNQKASLLIQKQGTVLFFGAVPINNAQSNVKLPLTGYPAGIIQVTLFDERMQPQCERLFFNMNNDAILPLTATMNNVAGLHKPVMVNLQAGQANDSLRIGSFSASVVNMSRLMQLPDNAAGIAAGLLLTPDLKGYIEQPDYYFEDYNSTKKYELDNLILCQGWRHIVWDSVKTGKVPLITFQPEKGFSISGTITKNNGQPVPNAQVTLLKAGSLSHIDTVADENGHFVFERLLLTDSTRFALQATDVSGNKKVNIKLDNQPAMPFIAGTDIPYNNNEFAYQAFLKNNYIQLPDSAKQRLQGVTALKEISIKGQKPNKVKYSANLNGPGVADETFTADQFQNYNSIEQYLDGRALGLRFSDGAAYSTRGAIAKTAQAGPAARPMQVFLDGTPMTRLTGQQNANTNDLDPPHPFEGITLDDIQSIEILRNADKTAIYGAPEGVILLTSKRADTRRFVPFAANYIPISVAGYNAIRTFYAPDYEAHPSSIPDHRATVYWKPDIITDKNGNASFKFFTTDDKGTYQLRIEGMTPDGKLAHLVKTIKVE